MATGTIKAVKIDRGFGFLRPSGADADVFFHANQLHRDLEFTDQLVELVVEFDVVTFEGRTRAVNVRPIEDDLPRVQRHG